MTDVTTTQSTDLSTVDANAFGAAPAHSEDIVIPKIQVMQKMSLGHPEKNCLVVIGAGHVEIPPFERADVVVGVEAEHVVDGHIMVKLASEFGSASDVDGAILLSPQPVEFGLSLVEMVLETSTSPDVCKERVGHR